MNRILLTVIVLLSSWTAWAARPVHLGGRITDTSTGEGIPGAIIRLDDNFLWTSTDLNGRWALEKVQQGSYKLEVACLGYVTVTTTVRANADLDELDFALSPATLALEEVVVTAETSKDNINTTRNLSRTALEHLQLNDMSGIAALLPGGKTLNPDLTRDNVLSLRSGGTATGNAAFGTAVEVDGVRLGGNASFSGLAGIGTRGVSVGTIESVEVITGVPSAEYGDLGSGIVRVTTRKGRAPLEVITAVNPRTWSASVSKGFDLGRNKGTLNIGGEWARATQKLTSPYTSYTRRGFSLDYTNLIARKLRLEAGLSGNIGGMNSQGDPDTFTEEFSQARDNMLTPHLKLAWMLNKPWITNLTLEGSVYWHDERTRAHTYYSYASAQPAVHAEEEGYFLAKTLPLTFYADPVVDSKELDYAASLKYGWLRHWGKTTSRLKAGVQYKATGNIGQGEFYLDPALAANGYRPRPYTDYPYLHNLSAYAEEDFSFPVGKTRIHLNPGVRMENVFVRGTDYDNLRTFSPRINAKWQFSKSTALRGGWGVTGKLPSFYVLYPRREYRDIQTFGYSFGSSGDASYLYYTQPYTMLTNDALQWQRSTNAEIGFETRVLGVTLSVVGWRNVTENPYTYEDVYLPFSYNVMALPAGYEMPAAPAVTIDSQTGYVYFRGDKEEYWTPADLKVADRTFVAARMAASGAPVTRQGVELTADFPEIRALRTHLRLDAAYTRTRYVDERLVQYYQAGWSHPTLANRSYPYVGIYVGNNGVSNGRLTENLDANLTAITHIPAARLVVTCRLEAAVLRRSLNLSEYQGKAYAFNVSESSSKPAGGDIYDGDSYTAVCPVAYLDLDGVRHPWTDAEAADPAFARLILRSGNTHVFQQDGYDPYFSANLSITKEIGNHVSLSFFANNFTNARQYVTSYATGVAAIFTPDFYYGLTCRIKL